MFYCKNIGKKYVNELHYLFIFLNLHLPFFSNLIQKDKLDIFDIKTHPTDWGIFFVIPQ